VNKRPNVQTGLNDLQGVYWLYKMQVIVRESVFHVYFVIFCVVANPNCSFPYTYNGGLYYGCINDMTGVSTADQPFACMAVNATPSVCDSPGVQTSWYCTVWYELQLFHDTLSPSYLLHCDYNVTADRAVFTAVNYITRLSHFALIIF